ncbi:hypothetical protein IWX46DRAFT_590735 [Phyllosticta citricarpa]|uniref:HPt domain-containing protein n=1 Tax=Phyllosticta citricarpa TaxID=55181 RepID=A0ABR1MMK4_9PEZI
MPSIRQPLSRFLKWTTTRRSANGIQPVRRPLFFFFFFFFLSLSLSSILFHYSPTLTRHLLYSRDSEKKDLAQLSQLGHFLKGSSATLGLTKVKDSCEKIQHFGAHKDETGTHNEPDDKVCLERLTKTIAQAKQEFKDVEKVLRKFYHDDTS